LKKTIDLKSLLGFENLAFKLLSHGSYIGDEEIIFFQNRLYSLKAATDCEFFVLKKIDFENIVRHDFPYIYNQIVLNCKKKIEHFERKS